MVHGASPLIASSVTRLFALPSSDLTRVVPFPAGSGRRLRVSA